MNPPGDDAPDLKIEEAVDLFIRRNSPDWKGETERTYRKSLATFEEYAADAGIETLEGISLWSAGQYTDWLLEEERDYASATIASKQKQARRWLKWLESQGLVDIGTHLAIEPLQLEDKEQTSSDILRPQRLREFLGFYRDSMRHRGTRAHALLEVIGHTGCRRSGIRALDVGDFDADDRTLQFINRPESGSRLKRGQIHQRKVVLSEEPSRVLEEFIARERARKHDQYGRKPLFASTQGRPAESSITRWLYLATLPCLMMDCPHGKHRPSCEWTEGSEASKCPSSKSPHPVRRGSITWQLNIGRDINDVADRAATTPDVIRRYYDQPDLDEDLRRRITDFDGIDLCKHSDPTDITDDTTDE